MSKNFKIARKPGQLAEVAATPPVEEPASSRNTQSSAIALKEDTVESGPTTRKTIEVPTGYFFQVKMRALKRHMKEKELWAEIVGEYLLNHPESP